ncbi:pyruvate kinase [soil metagenome]
MNISQYNRTKIVATLGPATMDPEVIEKMILAGVDVCRINGSHGEYEMMSHLINTVRAINEKLQTHIAILFDLQGPKIRIGDLTNGDFLLRDNEDFILTPHKVAGTREAVYIKYPNFHKDVKIGNRVLVDDGKIELEVTEFLSDERVKTKVIHGGMLSSRKGVNLPNTVISLPSLTEKDREDLEFAIQHDVEWIGLSFVRNPEDVIELKQIIKDKNSRSRVIAKIEKPEAVKNIDEIIAVADGVMVARGDLGVELPMEKVPVIQKLIVQKCNEASKPVIIATQMMESMINTYRPTRAEANDVGNAVYDGADALMLSGETSVGKFPIETVQAMQKIIKEVEKLDSIYFRETPPSRESENFITESICYTSCTMARQAEAKAIVAMTHSGMTAFKISSHRPKAHIYIFTDNKPILTLLNLVWGVRGFYYDKYESTDTTISDVKKYLVDHKHVKSGEFMIHVASTPLHEKSTANTIKLTHIE